MQTASGVFNFKNGPFEYGPIPLDTNRVIRNERQIQFSQDKKIISSDHPLINKYPNFFSKFFQNMPNDQLSMTQRKEEIMAKITPFFRIGCTIKSCTVNICPISYESVLLGVAFFANNQLLDLDKLPQTPLHIDGDEDSINGNPLSNFVIPPEITSDTISLRN